MIRHIRSLNVVIRHIRSLNVMIRHIRSLNVEIRHTRSLNVVIWHIGSLNAMTRNIRSLNVETRHTRSLNATPLNGSKTYADRRPLDGHEISGLTYYMSSYSLHLMHRHTLCPDLPHGFGLITSQTYTSCTDIPCVPSYPSSFPGT